MQATVTLDPDVEKLIKDSHQSKRDFFSSRH